MTKKKIVLAGLYYPMAMLSYFRNALEHRDDVELCTVGAYTGSWIPWAGGMHLDIKYVKPVTIPLDQRNLHPTWESIERFIPFQPDAVITVDAGWSFKNKPPVLSAHVATDPHVLEYDRKLSDHFFNMQMGYMQEGDYWLPYAFDKFTHMPTNDEKIFDATLIGLHYESRNEWIKRLQDRGVKINYQLGLVWDEYVKAFNQAKFGLNWSSKNDVTARVFEVMAMRLTPILNRLPFLEDFGFEDGRHYLGFSSMEEAVEKVIWAKEHPEQAKQIADEAYQYVNHKDMTYSSRIQTIFDVLGL